MLTKIFFKTFNFFFNYYYFVNFSNFIFLFNFFLSFFFNNSLNLIKNKLNKVLFFKKKTSSYFLFDLNNKNIFLNIFRKNFYNPIPGLFLLRSNYSKTLNKISKKKKNKFKKSSFFFDNSMCYDFFFLIGGLLSFYNWEFENKKKWFKKVILEELVLKNTTQPFLNDFNFSPHHIYFNNFFYFNYLKLNFSDFNYFIKITNLKLKSTNESVILYSKPYSFITNHVIIRDNIHLSTIHFNFKQFQKTTDYLNARNYSNMRSSHSANYNFKKIQNSLFILTSSNDFLNTNSKIHTPLNILETTPRIFLIKKILKTKNNSFIKFIKTFKQINIFFKKNSLKKTSSRFIKKYIKNFLILYNFNISSDFFFNQSSLTSTKLNFFFFLFNNANKEKVNTSFFFFKINSIYKKNLINLSLLFFQFEIFLKAAASFIPAFKQYHEKSNYFEINDEKHDHPFFLSKYNVSLVLCAGGFFYLSHTDYSLDTDNYYSYNLKKKHYSFLMKNEAQRFIIKHYLRSTGAFTLLDPEKLFKEKFDDLLQSFQQDSLNSINNKSIFYISNLTYYLSNFSSSFVNLLKKNMEDVEFSEKNENFFFIKKIKFKPGYMTFWREARSVFKEILNLNFKYQYKLTNYLSKYKKTLKFKIFISNEMTLLNILVRSRFFFDWTTTELFLKNNLIFVNGNNNYKLTSQIYSGDLIQMIVTHKYYILYRWFFHWISKKKTKLKIKTKKKLALILTDEDKTKTKTYPKWILSNRNIIDDSAKFLEIDFLTLSVVVLYEPISWEDLNIYSSQWSRLGITNMYNWKYIT